MTIKAIKKDIVSEFFQLTKDNIKEAVEFASTLYVTGIEQTGKGIEIAQQSYEYPIEVYFGDYIEKNGYGFLSVMSEWCFKERYEPLNT